MYTYRTHIHKYAHADMKKSQDHVQFDELCLGGESTRN